MRLEPSMQIKIFNTFRDADIWVSRHHNRIANVIDYIKDEGSIIVKYIPKHPFDECYETLEVNSTSDKYGQFDALKNLESDLKINDDFIGKVLTVEANTDHSKAHAIYVKKAKFTEVIYLEDYFSGGHEFWVPSDREFRDFYELYLNPAIKNAQNDNAAVLLSMENKPFKVDCLLKLAKMLHDDEDFDEYLVNHVKLYIPDMDRNDDFYKKFYGMIREG